jgi:hypothetical protein
MEPITAEPVPETEALVADTATEDSPETDALETPETDEAPRGITPEEVESRLKDEKAKWEAELRATYEEQVRTQAAAQRRTQAQQLRTGETANKLGSIAKWAYDQGDNGKEFRFNPQSVQQIALEMESAVFQDQSDAWGAAFNGYLSQQFKDFKPSQQTAQKLAAAFRDWRPDAAVAAQFDAMTEAVRADLEPKLRKEIEAELKTKGSASSKTQAMRDAEAARKAGGRPTGIGEAGGAVNDIRSVLDNPNASDAQKRAAFEKAYGFKPSF